MRILPPELKNAESLQARKASKGESKKSDSSSTGKGSSVGPKGDRVELSGAGSQMRTFRSGLSTVPDIRTERVAEIKAQIERGDYRPDSSLIADAMIQTVQKFT